MNKRIESIDYQEPISLKVGKWLMQRNLDLATFTRYPISSPEVSNSISILTNNPSTIITKKSFWGRTISKSWRTFLGTIWFKSLSSPEVDEKNWLFIVCGQNNVEFAKMLAKQMAEIFNVKISIKLSHGGPATEVRPDESCGIP